MTLFDLGQPETVATHKAIKNVKPPQWSADTTRARCDECMAAQHAGAAALSRKSQWRRRHDGTELRLCYDHATPIRDADDAAAKALTAQHFKR